MASYIENFIKHKPLSVQKTRTTSHKQDKIKKLRRCIFLECDIKNLNLNPNLSKTMENIHVSYINFLVEKFIENNLVCIQKSRMRSHK